MFRNLSKIMVPFFFVGISLFLVYPSANGADFPKKPLKLIATADVGGGEDTEARGIAPFLQKYFTKGVMIGSIKG